MLCGVCMVNEVNELFYSGQLILLTDLFYFGLNGKTCNYTLGFSPVVIYYHSTGTPILSFFVGGLLPFCCSKQLRAQIYGIDRKVVGDDIRAIETTKTA